MADNRKYYYLKLKENFFDSDSIVLLEDMKDGILYSNILLKQSCQLGKVPAVSSGAASPCPFQTWWAWSAVLRLL